jgi:hypothetical protein
MQNIQSSLSKDKGKAQRDTVLLKDQSIPTVHFFPKAS